MKNCDHMYYNIIDIKSFYDYLYIFQPIKSLISYFALLYGYKVESI